MIFFLPFWLGVALFVLRIAWRVLCALAEVVLLGLWTVALVCAYVVHLVLRIVRREPSWAREPEWARDTLRTIRGLEEVRR